MNLIKAKFEFVDQKFGNTQDEIIKNMWRHIEVCARVCYKSEGNMSEDISTAEPWVKKRLLNNADWERCHGAMTEHASVYLVTDRYDIGEFYNTNKKAAKFSRVVIDDGVYYISTNYRVIFENGREDDLKFISPMTKYHMPRYTVLFTVDRPTGEEFIRHRVASLGRESTRYVNYNKEKFGNGNIKVMTPHWMFGKFKETQVNRTISSYANDVALHDTSAWNEVDYWLFAIKSAEFSYNNLIEKCGWTPERARTILSFAICSPLVFTMFEDDWAHFFFLRAQGATGAPHPQAKELALPLMVEFMERGYNIGEKNLTWYETHKDEVEEYVDTINNGTIMVSYNEDEIVSLPNRYGDKTFLVKLDDYTYQLVYNNKFPLGESYEGNYDDSRKIVSIDPSGGPFIMIDTFTLAEDKTSKKMRVVYSDENPNKERRIILDKITIEDNNYILKFRDCL